MSPSEPPVRAQRRTSGARVEASERITLRAPNFETQGWTLNVGRGGVRVVLEERVEDGGEYELFFSDDRSGRRVRVAWLQDAADGQIAGLKYLDSELTPGFVADPSSAGEGSVPPPGRSDPPAGE